MSEGTNASEPSSGTEKLELGKPKKNKLWLAVVAVVIVVLLIGTAWVAGVFGPGKPKHTLTVTLEPDPVTVDAGKNTQLTAAVLFDNVAIAEANVEKIKWTISPTGLAILDRYGGKLTVTLTAGDSAGEGTVACTITHGGEEETDNVSLTVNPPAFDSVAIDPSSAMVDVGAHVIFNATAIDTVGGTMTGVTFEWSVSNLTASEYDLSATTGSSVTFTALAAGKGNLTLKGTLGSVVKWANASLALGSNVTREVQYRWYDFFNVPFQPYWDMRWAQTSIEQPLTDSYPYLYLWHGAPLGNTYYYSDSRLNITAKNLTGINMNRNPEFLPHLGTQRGGNAVIDWHFDYMNHDAVLARFPPSTAAWDDGWFLRFFGTTTLDKQGAVSVLGLTEDGYNNFATWWSANGPATSLAFQDWYKSEGNVRLDIYPLYEYALTILDWNLGATKVGDKIVITQDFVSWGMEGLLTRWMRESFMPTEWYMYNGTFHMQITPYFANLNYDAAVMYSLYMYETTVMPAGQTHADPCWVWEALMQDYVASSVAHPHSDFDPYQPFNYSNTAPGSAWYGKMMPYDYTPGTFNVSEGETLTFEWPAGDQLFIGQAFDGSDAPILGKTVNYSAPMMLEYSEPMDTDNADQYITPGNIVIDNVNRIMTFTGPIDMYHWSQHQTNHSWLASEWARMNMLPYGAPYIEWAMGVVEPAHADHIVISEIADPVVANETESFTVTVYDQRDEVYTGYRGTVNFTANRTGVTLPVNYTFTQADAGVHVFATNLSFHDLGYYNLTVKDTVTSSVTGWKSGIWVVPTAPAIDHFNVYIGRELSPGFANDLTVVAINQYGTVFTTYNGTVSVSTNATGGTYTLPGNYVFKPSDNGNKTFAGGVTFNNAGTYSLDVQDVYNVSATGSVTGIVVKAWPEITYKMYDMFKPIFDEWFWTKANYGRIVQYYQDYILANFTGKHAWLYAPDPDASEHTVIFAPYRWSIDAKNVTAVTVHHPEFSYIDGTSGPQANAEVNMTVRMDYITYAEWLNYWIPNWGWIRPDHPWNETTVMQGWWGGQTDGYQVGVLYNVTMNREAALEWIGMPLAADVTTWYNNGNGIYTYEDAWIAWITNEANSRVDIYAGYDDIWYYGFNWMRVSEIQSTGDVVLTIAEVDWGYDVLITRWLTEANLCLHEPYYEDLTMYANYSDAMSDVYLDAVAEYSLRAVGANQSAGNAGAWAWEPTKIDYVSSWSGSKYHKSFFDPYVNLTYKSRNPGDVFFGQQVGYDATPWWFNLTSHQKLIIQLPTGNNVLGFYAQGTSPGSFKDAQKFNPHNYTALMYNGTMDLGFFETGGVDLRPMYNAATKTLTITGPVEFDYPRNASTHLLYHGAPWIEFNVSTTSSSLSLPVPTGTSAPTVSGPVAAGSSSLMALVLVATLAIGAIGVLVRRRE